MRAFATPWLQHVLSITSNTGFTDKDLYNLFGPSLSLNAEIILPSAGNFSERLTPRWTNYLSPSYIGAIKPATETDIQKIVGNYTSINLLKSTNTVGGYIY
jgi:hypothetical protein